MPGGEQEALGASRSLADLLAGLGVSELPQLRMRQGTAVPGVKQGLCWWV